MMNVSRSDAGMGYRGWRYLVDSLPGLGEFSGLGDQSGLDSLLSLGDLSGQGDLLSLGGLSSLDD